MKPPASKKAAPSLNAAQPAQAKKRRNPSKQKRLKARQEREAIAAKHLTLSVSPKVVCSNPKFHPHHCDCPVHEDVLAFIDKGALKKTTVKETPLVTSFVFHDDRPALKSVFEQEFEDEPIGGPTRLDEIVSDLFETDRYQTLVNNLRDAQCEVGSLKAKIRTQEKMLESLENQLKEARNVKRAKIDRRNRVRNRRASDKAFDMGVIGIGRDEWSIK